MFIDGVIKKEQLGFNSSHDYIDYIKKENQGAFFLPTLIAGLPNVPACAEIILQLENNGAKMIELFLPTQDAFVENATITKAMDQALANQLYMSDCFDLVSLVRQRGCRIPIILRSYFSSVFNYGLAKFVKKCHLSGINILHIQNLPLSKIHEISPYLRKNNIEFTCELGKKQNNKQIFALNNPPSNISMIYKNMLRLEENKTTGFQTSVINDKVLDEIIHLKESISKNIAICGSFKVNNDDDIKNLSEVIDVIDLFAFKSCLVPLQYIQPVENKDFQEKSLYEQSKIIVDRVVNKAKDYINIKKLIDDYNSKENSMLDSNLDIDNLIENEVTIDVIDLKTKEERQKERELAEEQEKSLEESPQEPTNESEKEKASQKNENAESTILAEPTPKEDDI